jgi:hypothetical protein
MMQLEAFVPPALVLAALLSACQRPGDLEVVLAAGGAVLPAARGFAVRGGDAAAAAGAAPPGAGGAARAAGSDPRALIGRRQGEVLKVSVYRDVPAERAERLMNERWALIRSLYEPQRSPYPELLTRLSSCPAEFMPRPKRHPAGRYYQLLAGERLGFGVCSRDQARYSAGVVLLGCPAARSVVEAAAFVPGADRQAAVDALLEGLRCR